MNDNIQKLPTINQQPVTPMQMLQIAVEKGADIDKLQQLMELQQRWEANEAKKAYVAAMTAFKANQPEILKTRHVRIKTKQGGIMEYKHADLNEVSRAIGSEFSKHGLSHHWKTEQLDGGQVRVTCVITHELGHSESVSLQSGADQSGGKNNIQAVGSTVTYLQRYTLLSATGLATQEQDDDGAGADIEWISEEQVANLAALLDETGASEKSFLGWLGAKSLDRIQASAYDSAVRALEKKRKI